MNVAVMKTKAEQALTETFAAIADKLPGGAAVRSARAEAIGRFGALGLPHRRIEAWKYTDLRNLMKEALPPAVDDAATRDERRARSWRWGRSRTLDAHRVVFVDGRYARGAVGRSQAPRALDVDVAGDALAHERHDDVGRAAARSTAATTSRSWR